MNDKSKKGGSLGKRLADLVFDQPKGTNQQPVSQEVSATPPASEATQTSDHSLLVRDLPTSSGDGGIVDPETLALLRTRVIPAGSLCLDFQGIFASLKSIIPDEQTRFDAALQATLASKGAKKDTLAKQTRECLERLPQERLLLNESANQKLNGSVAAKEHSLGLIVSDIASKKQQVEAMLQAIETLEREKKEVERGIDEERERIESMRRSCLGAMDIVSAELRAVLNRLVGQSSS